MYGKHSSCQLFSYKCSVTLPLQTKQELSDSKLDLRVAEREAKATQDTIAFLREKNREQRTQLGEKEVS